MEELVNFFDRNLELLWGMRMEVLRLTHEAVAVSLASPMARDRTRTLSDAITDKVSGEVANAADPSPEQVAVAKGQMEVTILVFRLVHANFEHNVARGMSRRVLSLRLVLYRLLLALVAAAAFATWANVESTNGVPDVFNMLLIAILVGWLVYMIVWLVKEVRHLTRLEDEVRRQEDKATQRKEQVRDVE